MQEDTQGGKVREIDLVKIAGRIWAEKKLLAVFVSVFAVMGVVYALNKQKTYTSIVVLAPEATSMGMSSSLSDIAGMVGLNMGGVGNGVDAIYPDIYPDIFTSSDFIVGLFDIPVKGEGMDKPKRYYDHIRQDTNTPFWSLPMAWIRQLMASGETGKPGKFNPKHLTKEQDGVYGAILGSIGCQLNKGTNVVTITATDTDPVIAAAIADTLQTRLQEYITRYRTQKARNDLAYAQKLNAEAKQMYVKARQKYSSYADANTDVVLKSYLAVQNDLENEMQLLYNNYTQTAAQVQQAKARVQENTPAFTIIQGATVPLRASSTPRSFMVIGFCMFGAVLHAAWVLFGRSLLRRKGKK